MRVTLIVATVAYLTLFALLVRWLVRAIGGRA